jgi:MFS family permease
MHPDGTSIIADKFDRKSVRALSLFYGLGYIGNIISPIILSVIVSNSLRVEAFVLRFGFFAFITGLTVMLYLRGEPMATKSN